MDVFGMIYVPSFMKIGPGVHGTLRFCLRNLRGCNVGVMDGEGFMNYTVEMESGAIICIPSFIKIGSGTQS
jgi:hypothetical protein